MRRRRLAISLLLLGLGLLAGCGQKGALLLPTKPATSAPAAASTVAPAPPPAAASGN